MELVNQFVIYQPSFYSAEILGHALNQAHHANTFTNVLCSIHKISTSDTEQYLNINSSDSDSQILDCSSTYQVPRYTKQDEAKRLIDLNRDKAFPETTLSPLHVPSSLLPKVTIDDSSFDFNDGDEESVEISDSIGQLQFQIFLYLFDFGHVCHYIILS